MKGKILLTIMGLNAGVAMGQQGILERRLDPITQNELIGLKKQITNKQVLNEYHDVIYHTLSFFPELKGTSIKFKYGKLRTTLNARPSLYSLFFKKRENRNYIVRINKSKRDSSINLAGVNYNAQIGVLAHEFSHFIDYSEKGFWGIFNRLLSYTNKESKAKFEKEIDQLTIDRGLGWQLHDWAHTVLYDSNACYRYRKLKREVYLTPRSIKEYIDSINYEVQPRLLVQ